MLHDFSLATHVRLLVGTAVFDASARLNEAFLTELVPGDPGRLIAIVIGACFACSAATWRELDPVVTWLEGYL